jgi:hypothetical protein
MDWKRVLVWLARNVVPAILLAKAEKADKADTKGA